MDVQVNLILKLKTVKYIAIIFIVAFVISVIGGIGLNIWGFSNIFKPNNSSNYTEEEYQERIKAKMLRDHYNPIVDSLLDANPKVAIAYIDSVLTRYPSEYKMVLKQGVGFYRIDSLEKAITLFEKAMEVRGEEFPEALHYIGWTLTDLKKYDLAIAQFNKAATISNGYVNDFYIAETYELKGDTIKAINYYKLFLSNLESLNSNLQYWEDIRDVKKKITELEDK